MSIDSITGDEFMSFTPEDHQVALGLYDPAIDAATSELAQRQLYGPQRNQLLDRLTSLLTLRKLHKVRLAEMQEEEQPGSKMGVGSQGLTSLAA